MSPPTRWLGGLTPDRGVVADTPPPAAGLPLPAVQGYTLLRLLGRGGMGAVYEADQHDPPRRVAVKLIARDSLDPDAAARFAVERQAIARMDHPHVARVYDAGLTADGVPFFAMELAHGPPLTAYCREKELGVPARLELFVGVCKAVQHAHQKGVIHRDLKPSNLLVGEVDGRPVPKVIDFGVAKLVGDTGGGASVTQFGLVAGTPLYMAPEQANPLAHVDTRADVYALGVLLFELLTGRTPLDPTELNRLTPTEVLRRVSGQTPLKPSTAVGAGRTVRSAGPPAGGPLPEELDWIVLKCLQHDPPDRYQSADQLADDLERFLRCEPTSAHPLSRWYAARKFVRRNRGPVAAAAAMLALLVAGAAGTSLGMVSAIREQRVADALRDEAEVQREEAMAQRRVADEQRSLAERRFTAAQDAYRQMVFDIQDRLTHRAGVNELRVELLTKARAGLESLAAEAGEDPRSQTTLAFARYRLAEVEQFLGRSSEACDQCRAGLGIAERVLEVAPDSAEHRYAVAFGYGLLAEVSSTAGRKPDQLAAATTAVEQFRRLAEEAPTDERIQDQFHRGLGRLGQARLEAGDVNGALACFREGSEVYAALDAAGRIRGTAQGDRGCLPLQVGIALMQLGKNDEAKVEVEKAITAGREFLERYPAHTRARRNLLVGIFTRGDIEYELGDLPSADASYREFHRLLAQMAAEDPKNLQYQQDIASSLMRLGQVASRTGRHREAVQHYAEARDRYARLVAADPKNRSSNSDLYCACLEGVVPHRALKDFEGVQKWLTRAEELVKAGRVELNAKQSAELKSQLAECDLVEKLLAEPDGLFAQADDRIPGLADSLVGAMLFRGRKTDAAATAERFAKWADGLTADRDAQRYNGTCLFARCAAGTPPDDKLVGRAVDLLTALRTDGYFTEQRLAHLHTDRDFDGIRRHPRFVSWVKGK